ncbi:DeoR/GlpR family DNA-binding transcription regulator [Lapidilactobacillus luobeiensis]|uniref:DeoR/GlpR family DNA-binding transcription regulator n=1 Tax=Lapidilactobacillus luobeiensis TaxID=2950371 RepID=UPI0021C3AC0A|nr:DeoR/GlpR family DNA-binding transcription regulator [Lapidilactobacillus luobeiensis]
MLPFQRKQFIVQKTQNGITYIPELAEELDVSEVTVRRDLKALEEDHVVEVHRGGAVQYLNTTEETAMALREQIYSEEKVRIGKYAASFIKNGDVVFIDSGTTTQTIFNYLKDKSNLVIVTNGYKNLEIATNSGLENIVLLGGEYKPRTGSFLGSITENDLGQFYFDKSFIGANGVDENIGMTNANLMESSLKQKAIARSRKTFALVDHSKFGMKANFFFSSIQDVEILCDGCPAEYKKFDNITIV